jgi:hypothetical protein
MLPLWLLTVTVTVTAPAACAGTVAVIDVLFTTTTFVAAVPPKVTLAPAAKFVPVIVTPVPPVVSPLFGETLLTIGDVVYVNPLTRLAFWLFTVTVTVTVPAAPGGVLAVIVELFSTFTLVAGTPPNVTLAPETNFAPVIVTAVPPAVGPRLGETLPMLRGAT